jgi:hypothetical protein
MKWPWVSRRRFEEAEWYRRNAEAAFDKLLDMLQSDRQRHEREMADLLDRLLPKPREPVPGTSVIGPPPSSAVLSRTPAVGKRGIRERNAAVQDAQLREEEESEERKIERRRNSLTSEEARRLDEQIPV